MNHLPENIDVPKVIGTRAMSRHMSSAPRGALEHHRITFEIIRARSKTSVPVRF